MNRASGLTKNEQGMLAVMLGIAIFAPIFLHASSSLPWIPGWLGAAIGIAALLGTFLLFWRAGALRIRFLVVLSIAICVVAAYAVLLRHT